MDLYIFEKINSFAGRYQWLDLIGILFSWYAGYALVGAALIFLTLKYGRRNFVTVCGALVAGSIARLGVTEIIRFFYDRPRPFEVLDIIQLIRRDSGHSFPSGHAAFFFAFSYMIWARNRILGIVFFVVSALIGFGRIFVGFHWPLDVLGGALIGILIGWVTMVFLKKYKTLE